MYQMNTFNIAKMRVSMNGRGAGGGSNQKTTKKCHEVKRNLTITSKTSLENAKEIHNHLALAFI